MNIFKKIIQRIRCKHDRQHLQKYYDVYSDLWGYDHTKFVFICRDCGRKHVFKTRNPDYFIDLLCEAGRKES